MENKVRMAWTKPELIVLERSRPEEAVLTVCKHPKGPATTSIGSNNGCQIQQQCNSGADS